MEKENTIFSVAEIKELMQAMKQNAMGKLKIKHGEYSISLEEIDNGCSGVVVREQVAVSVAENPQAAKLPEPEQGKVVSAPIVGTFYASPSPESEPYVCVGSKVKKGDVLFIIESMKLMNEVTSQFDGTVAKICVQNSEAVEYGQPVMTIE